VSEAEELLAFHLRAAGRERGAVREFRFAAPRRWRFDFAWVPEHVAVEVDGGSWSGGRHTSGSGFEADCEKLSEAAALGWRVLRVTPRMIQTGAALALIERALQWRREPIG
jgi:very-short-patch-repair endonuclease